METIDVEEILDVSLHRLTCSSFHEPIMVYHSDPLMVVRGESLDSPTDPPGQVLLAKQVKTPNEITFIPLFFGQLNEDLQKSILLDISNNDYTPYAITFTYPDISCNYKKTVYSDKKKKNVIRTYNCSLSEAPDDIQYRKITRDINSWMGNVQKHLPTSSAIKQIAVCFEKTKSNIIHGHGILTMNNKYIQAVSQVFAMYWIRISKGSYNAMHKKKGHHTDNAFDKCSDVSKWVFYMMKECRSFLFPFQRTTFAEYLRNKKHYPEIFPSDNEVEQIMPDSWQQKQPIFIDFL